MSGLLRYSHPFLRAVLALAIGGCSNSGALRTGSTPPRPVAQHQLAATAPANTSAGSNWVTTTEPAPQSMHWPYEPDDAEQAKPTPDRTDWPVMPPIPASVAPSAGQSQKDAPQPAAAAVPTPVDGPTAIRKGPTPPAQVPQYPNMASSSVSTPSEVKRPKVIGPPEWSRVTPMSKMIPLTPDPQAESLLTETQSITLKMIAASKLEYRKFNGACPCPDDRNANGEPCGLNSGYYGPIHNKPLCYSTDVTQDMINDYKRTGSIIFAER